MILADSSEQRQQALQQAWQQLQNLYMHLWQRCAEFQPDRLFTQAVDQNHLDWPYYNAQSIEHWEAEYQQLTTSQAYQSAFGQFINAWANHPTAAITPQADHPSTSLSAPPQFCSRELIYQQQKIKLYRYLSLTPVTHPTPLLIVYALVNRPDILDIASTTSFIKQLLIAGFDVYLLDWGRPDQLEQQHNLSNYINNYLHNCVELIYQTQQQAITLMGICQGGVLSLCYASLHPHYLKNLVLITTPVDFQTPDNRLSYLLQPIAIDKLVTATGNIPGYWLTQQFLQLRPFHLIWQKYQQLLAAQHDPHKLEFFCRVEQWIMDNPDHPAELFRIFAKEFYQQNNLIKGKIKIAKRYIKLAQLQLPVLNLYANEDVLIPASAAMALQDHLNPQYYHSLAYDGGHTSIYLSPKTQAVVMPQLVHWLQQY